jgi:cation transport ATPase
MGPTREHRPPRQNPWWAAGYHLVGVTLAAGAPAPIGFAISTPVGASPMSSSADVAVPTERRV